MDHFGFLTPCFLIYIGHQLCDLVTLISHNIERLCIKQVEIKKEIIDVDIEEVQQLQVGIFRREATSPEFCPFINSSVLGDAYIMCIYRSTC